MGEGRREGERMGGEQRKMWSVIKKYTASKISFLVP